MQQVHARNYPDPGARGRAYAIYADGTSARSAWPDPLGTAARLHLAASGELNTNEGGLEAVLLPGSPPTWIIYAGVGEGRIGANARVVRFAGACARAACERALASLEIVVPFEAGEDAFRIGSLAAEGAVIGSHAARNDCRIGLLPGGDALSAEDFAAFEAGVRRGVVVGLATNRARSWTSARANALSPARFSDEVIELGRHHAKIVVESKDYAAISALGAGGIAAVAAAAGDARLLVVRYDGASRSSKRLGLVGKGITFDSGGLQIKSTQGMANMYNDKGGAAAVLAATFALADLGVPCNVVAVVALAENAVGPSAVHPGDVVRALDGTDIEVTNTDAEGRLVLADAITYARRCGATSIIDVGSLEGSMLGLLGRSITPLFTNDTSFASGFVRASSGREEAFWAMPITPEASLRLSSDVALLRNSISDGPTVQFAAAFLGEFARGIPWIHLDTGETNWISDALPHMSPGATGVPVRSLIAFGLSQVDDVRGNPAVGI